MLSSHLRTPARNRHIESQCKHFKNINMIAKVILVLIYFLLVFLVAKCLDLSSNWLDLGCVASPLFNPFAVSVRRLKTLLDERGISYVGVVDKAELAQLVKASGSFSSDENCTEIVDNRENENDGENTYFRSSSHLYEKIEDTKASGWLVQIIPQYRGSLLSVKQWAKLSRKVTLLGIKTAVFDCSLDPRLCARNGWDAKCLLLSSPVGQHAKGNVNIHVYNSKPSVERAFSWLNNVLATRVDTLKTHKEYLKYLEKHENNYETTKIVLFGRLEDPPALLSSLSIKFTERVHFAYFKITKENADEIREKIGIYKVSRLLVVTPERRFFYGTRKGEVLQYKAMEIFLTSLHPEVNDIFLLAIILVNQICVLELFLTPGGILRKSVKFLLFGALANMALMITWLPLVGMFRFNFAQPLLNIGLKICRFVTVSDLVSSVRYYFLTYSGSPMWFVFSFCVYGFCANQFRKRFKLLYNDDDDSSDWFYHDLVYFRRFFHSFRPTRMLLANTRVNDDNLFSRTYEDIVIQRLATPDLWLRPLMPTDFVEDLPVWKNCNCPPPTEAKSRKVSNKEKVICDPNLCQWKCRPGKILMTKECAICLDNYVKDCILVSVPCRHVFHQHCLEKWFKSGNQCKNLNCPVCRWPAYKAKAEILDVPEMLEMNSALD